MSLSEEVLAASKPSHSENLRTSRVNAFLALLPVRTGLFLLFNLIYGSVFYSQLADLFGYSLNGQYYPFGLIPVLTLYLLYTRRHELFANAVYGARSGMAIALLGVLLYGLGLNLRPALSPNDFASLTTLGLVIVWIGGFVLCFGIPGARTVLFPLFFLVLAIPPPEALLFHLITVLQYASAEVTYVLFKLLPMPIFRDGIYFSLPGLDIEVARSCSGIRSSVALLVTCALASHLLLQRWWSRSLVLLLVFPLAIFKNGLRIVTLCLLTIYVDEGFINGNLHNRGGIVFFGLALAMMALIVLGLRKAESR